MSSDSIGRRQLLKGLGASTGLGALAGCGGQGDTGDGGSDGGDDGGDSGSPNELGERVPTIDLHYYTWEGANEAMAPLLENYIEELGFDVEVTNVEPLKFVGDALGDKRTHHLGIFGHTPAGSRLDPNEFVIRFAADRAGPDGNSYANYANCEYSRPAHKQNQVATEEERRELVAQTQEIFGRDHVMFMLQSGYGVGVARKDAAEWKGLGKKGLNVQNYQFEIYSEANKDSLNMALGPGWGETLNFLSQNSASPQAQWFHLPNSCLFEYTEDWTGPENVIAESYSYSNDATRLEVTLREGTFHNGDPITAEDVKFTFEYLDEFKGSIPIAADQGFESIEAVSDREVVFNFETPKLTFRTSYAPLIPILHKGTFEAMGASDNPDNIDFTLDNWVGSGAFTVSNFEQGRQVSFEPHDGHPYYPTPGHNINWLVYQDNQPKVNAFKEGEVDVIWTIGDSFVRNLQNSMSEDQLLVRETLDFGPDFIVPQHGHSPTQFREFRKAASYSLNREEINQVTTEGNASVLEYVSMFTEAHPWRVSEDRLEKIPSKTGDIQAAQEALEAEGWVFQNGNWHYPSDKDLSPPWPQGENPSAPEFPCLTEDGEWAG